MWILSCHIVIYFCALITAAEIYSKFGQNHRKTLLKRSLGVNNKYNYLYTNNLKLRHQSRFPKLDKVMTRVSDMRFNSGENNNSNEVYNKLRHNSVWYEKRKITTTTTKPDEEFANYFDDEYENDKEEENWGYEDNEDSNEYENYDDDVAEWQAEEPTEKPTTEHSNLRKISKLGEMKWQMYGNRENLEQNRKKELSRETSATLARVHFMRINSEGTCKKPLPRVISVQNEHPDPTRTYTPQCTVLHRCAEDTGCCLTQNMRCGPKKQEEVHLYFYSKTLGTLVAKIERLTFWNHTECMCIQKTKSDSNENLNINPKNEMNFRNTTPQNIERCVCPGSFSPNQKYGNQCTCNCEGAKPGCETMKSGLEYFSLADRKCVLEKKCGIPICEFGAYLRLKGRCPRKEEKIEAFEQFNVDY